MIVQVKEEDVAEVVGYLRENMQYHRAQLVTYLYNFFRLHAGVQPCLGDENKISQEENDER